MAITYNSDLLGKLYAPGISDFTAFDPPNIGEAHPEAAHWLAKHFLNSIFRTEYKNKYRQYAINQMYRAQAIDLLGQLHQWVAQVDDVDKLLTKGV